jgi:hypothetical protein
LFQLFKIPIKEYNKNEHYDIVICNKLPPANNYNTLILFSDKSLSIDGNVLSREIKNIKVNSLTLPFYTNAKSFDGNILRVFETNGKTISRFGYDIFKETSFLLNVGQPEKYADVPAIALHIEMLRNIIKEKTLLLEIPPIPYEYNYILALTHDVDHLTLREHAHDRWILSYIYRCTLFNLYEFLKHKKNSKQFIGSIKGIFQFFGSLLGLCNDPWYQFEEFLKLEKKFGVKSTFYFTPFKNLAGIMPDGKNAKWTRASKYSLEAAENIINKLEKLGWEVGCHGINSWIDITNAKNELERIKQFVKSLSIGIRMHWLFFSKNSWYAVDQTGFQYDTTFGYNENSGFKAGTLQVYKPYRSKQLLELPIHIQDGALFSKDRLHLSNVDAIKKSEKILRYAKKYGGVITLLLHSESLGAPHFRKEFYETLLKKGIEDNVWMTQAIDVVKWFQSRRALDFASTEIEKNKIIIKIQYEEKIRPEPRLRIYLDPKKIKNVDGEWIKGENYIDIKINKETFIIRLNNE